MLVGKAQFPFRWECVLVSVFFCCLEGGEGLNGGSVEVPRIGWDSDNCLRLPSPGSAAVPCSLHELLCPPSARALGKF